MYEGNLAVMTDGDSAVVTHTVTLSKLQGDFVGLLMQQLCLHALTLLVLQREIIQKHLHF